MEERNNNLLCLQQFCLQQEIWGLKNEIRELQEEKDKENFFDIDFSLVDNLSLNNFINLRDYCQKNWIEEWRNIKSDPISLKKYRKFSVLFETSNDFKFHISSTADQKFFKGALRPGEITLFSAPPGCGKTAFSIMLTAVHLTGFNSFISENHTFEKKKVLYFSLELSKSDLINRVKSTLLALNNVEQATAYSSLIIGDANEKTTALADLLFDIYSENLKIISYEDFDSSITVEQIKEYVSCIEQNTIVIIDRHELIYGDTKMSDSIIRKLKDIASRYSIPIILQSQMTKQSLQSAYKDGKYDITKLSGESIKGTSGLDQFASVVIIMVVDEENIMDFHGFEAKKATFMITKNRNSPKGMFELSFVGALNLFLEYNENREEKINVK